MVNIKPFKCYQCKPDLAEEICIPTMDTYLRGEKVDELLNKRHTFLRVTHPFIFNKDLEEKECIEDKGLKTL